MNDCRNCRHKQVRSEDMPCSTCRPREVQWTHWQPVAREAATNLPPEAREYLALVEAAKFDSLQLDIRVGCVAVYEGEKLNCLDQPERTFLYYRHGFYDENTGWTVCETDIKKAKVIAAAPTAITRLCEMLAEERALCDRLAESLRARTQNTQDRNPKVLSDYAAHRAKEAK